MSRRGRAVAFLLLALLAAAAAAAIADRYGSRVARGYGTLRPVVVLDSDLPAGKRIGPAEIDSALAVRRVPERFVPPGALASPAEAFGLAAEVALPAGSYLLAAQIAPPRRGGPDAEGLGGGRRPVEIAVSGAGALLAAGPAPAGAKVDVVVTSEPAGAGPGRTFVAAAGVPLLALRPGVEGPGPGGTAAATLGLTRKQALRLIAAESFARKVTVLPWG
ncbi:MAG TPA: SAF domain-containing protein [Solirubrobacterales bacterium]|nr:SAF domain-containing protein [Solirubrobacterales bacterium]